MEQDGELIIIGIAQPGTFVGVQALYGEVAFPFSVEAMTDTEVCMKDIKVFRDKGIIKVNGQTIEILDSDKLESLCKCKSLVAYAVQGS